MHALHAMLLECALALNKPVFPDLLPAFNAPNRGPLYPMPACNLYIIISRH